MWEVVAGNLIKVEKRKSKLALKIQQMKSLAFEEKKIFSLYYADAI
jgi:hypothetical protein